MNLSNLLVFNNKHRVSMIFRRECLDDGATVLYTETHSASPFENTVESIFSVGFHFSFLKASWFYSHRNTRFLLVLSE